MTITSYSPRTLARRKLPGSSIGPHPIRRRSWGAGLPLPLRRTSPGLRRGLVWERERELSLAIGLSLAFTVLIMVAMLPNPTSWVVLFRVRRRCFLPESAMVLRAMSGSARLPAAVMTLVVTHLPSVGLAVAAPVAALMMASNAGRLVWWADLGGGAESRDRTNAFTQPEKRESSGRSADSCAVSGSPLSPRQASTSHGRRGEKVPPAGIEPATYGLGNHRSIH